ncbi:MAG: DUF7948 domain-containing protein [Bacteroidia bacterium]
MFLAKSSVSANEAPAKEKATEFLKNQPAIFRKNCGQLPSEILYRTNAYGSNIYFMKNSLSFGFKREKEDDENKEQEKTERSNDQKEDYETLVWNLHFVGSSDHVTVTSEQEQKSKTNYIIGNDPAKWKSNVSDYGKIIYNNIYENIDLQYYGTGKKLKYDYIVHPQGAVNTIKMACEGIKGLTINSKGELEIKTSWGTQLERAPYAYQLINGEQKKIDLRFEIINDTTFGFKTFQKYDTSKDLIIDPVILEWSTFIGGPSPGGGYVYDIAVDAAGNTYATGWYEDNFPVTAGAYDQTYNAGGSCGLAGSFEDIYVIKINPSATSIIYATYVGGGCAERGRGIAINAAGEAFVTGWTKSTDFPTVLPFQPVNNGSVDAVAFRLNASGSALIYSTYLGGTYNDWAEKVALDAADNVYLVGASLDAAGTNTFPVTAGSFQPTYGGGMWQSDGYITKLDATGGMVYSSFMGGSAWDWAYSVAVNSAGEAFVTGRAQAGYPTTAGAYQTLNAGADDVFITRINSTGSSMIYSTMVGGSTATSGSCACENGNYIVINSADEAYVTGNVRSSNFPTTPGVFQPAYGGGYYGDAFVLKMNSTGTSLLLSTYLGGTSLDIGWGMDINSIGEMFIAGYTDAANFPTTVCDYDHTYNGTTDADFFVAKFNPTATTLMYSTFIGGNDQDYWEPKIKVLGTLCDQRAIFSGTSHSINFPTTAGVIQPVKLNGVDDQPVILKLKPKIYPGFTVSPSVTPCLSSLITVTDTTSSCGNWGIPLTIHNWDFGDGTTASGITATHTYASSGTYTIQLIVGCPTDTITKTITVSSNTLPSTSAITGVSPLCQNAVGTIYSVTNTVGSTYNWTVPPGAVITSGQGTNSINVNWGTTGGTISVIETNPCGSDTAVVYPVTITPAPVVTFSQNINQGCSPLLVNFTDATVVNPGDTITSWSWVFGDGNISSLQNPSNIYAIAGSYNVTLTITTNLGCTATTTVTNAVNIFPNPTAAFTTQESVINISDPTVHFIDQSVYTINSWMWSFGDGDSSLIQNPEHVFPDPGAYNVVLTVTNQYGCIDSTHRTIDVLDEFTFYIPDSFTPNGDGMNDTFQGYGLNIGTYEMLIFDRWGELIFQTNDYKRPWNGTAKRSSAIVQEDVYVYKIALDESSTGKHHEYIGRVTVVK